MTTPCDLSAVDARRLIGTKELSPVELLDSCIDRIEAVNPTVNAVVATCYERAREEARAAEHAVMQSEPLGPLHGLPFGVKDLNLTEGVRTTFGSLIHEDFVPEEDERMVADLRAAGAILVGKMREFCRTWPNQSEVTVKGIHFIQEDSADEIGSAVSKWLRGL